MSIEKKISQIQSQVGSKVSLVAVSKTKSEIEITRAYKFGQRIFGENKVQELVSKQNNLPKDINCKVHCSIYKTNSRSWQFKTFERNK